MLGQRNPNAPRLPAVENIQAWTRRRFELAPDAPVLVAEVRCAVPLCPPLETAVAFWTPNERRHQFRLFKPVCEVVYDDIGWLIGLPVGSEETNWDCC
jgi:nitrate reductase delta subunit